MKRAAMTLTSLLILTALTPEASRAQTSFPDSPTGRAAAAIVETIDSGEVERIERFVRETLDAGFQEAFPMDQHVAIFADLHEQLSPVEVLAVEKTGPTSATLVLSSADGNERRKIEFEVHEDPPHRIAGLGIDEVDSASGSEPDKPIELGDGPWAEKLDRALNGLVGEGFSGVAMAVTDGEVVLAEGYGMADRQRKIVNTATTVFSIGSITKDFTRAAILKLEEQGKLSTLDPLSKFFPEAPDDKKPIQLLQVMDHEAGFHEYHDTEGDHQPMDRGEAERIILAQPLRFEPGAQSRYSNSGYTLLAIVVERVSGVSYQDFVREQLLKPAGMARTGFFGESIWKPEEVATGYGARTLGEINSPLHWPGVSWVLTGAGGMVSSLEDLRRWHRALSPDRTDSAGSVLGRAALAKYHGERSSRPMSAMAGGGDYGFLAIVFAYHQGGVAGDLLIVLSNSGASRRLEQTLLAIARAHLDD